MQLQAIQILQIIVAILLILSILLQNRGAGLGASFGGGGEIYRTKRGAEKVIFYFTVIISILFVIVCILAVRLG